MLKSFRLFFFLTAAVLFFPSVLRAVEPSVKKDDAVARYQQAVVAMEEMNVYEDDVFKIIPRIRMTSRALLDNDFEKAGTLLTQIEEDLELLKAQKPVSIRNRQKFVWMELALDLFQKFIYILLFAYLFARWPYFNTALVHHRFTLIGRLYLTLVFSGVSILLSFFDLSRYGESAWSFFDIQIVFITAGALLGGFWAGVSSGVLIGIFRWLLKPDAFVYIMLALSAGLAGGLFARRVRHVESAGAVAFTTGAGIGLLHGLVIYVPLIRFMPWPYFAFTILSLAALEGAAVLLFFKVASNVIHEQSKRQLEHDYLKAQVMLLQAQMSPHFLFNTLNTIAAICSRENASQAHHLVLRLADFLRRTLRRDEKVTLKEEMDYIDAYLEIEKARFQSRLNIEKKIQLEDSDWEIPIPLLILQPLVENAVRHGIAKKESGGTVEIRMTSEKETIVIDIRDDGVGMDPKTVFQNQKLKKDGVDEGLGIGLKNIHERLLKIYGRDYGLLIQGKKGEGTTARVRIPKKKKKGNA